MSGGLRGRSLILMLGYEVGEARSAGLTSGEEACLGV